MNVFIARGSVDIGRFPQEQLPELARQGVIKRTDTYWHKGMDGWEPISDLLPPSVWEPGNETPVLDPIAERRKQPADVSSGGSAPESSETPPRRGPAWGVVAAVCLAGLFGLAALGYLLIKPDSDPMEPATAKRSFDGLPRAGSAQAMAVREKAAADLQQRIARLPQKPSPPLNTYYYDITTELEETFAARTSWRAVIRGRENVLKPESEETLSQTEFTVTAEYGDGEWMYKTYRGTISNTEEQTSIPVQHDSTRLAPPVLIGILGLKTADYSPAPR